MSSYDRSLVYIFLLNLYSLLRFMECQPVWQSFGMQVVIIENKEEYACENMIQYQQSREGPNCTADLLLVIGSLQWWGVVGSFLMFQGVLWYFWFFRSVEFMGTIVEHDRLLLSRPFGRYWVIHQLKFKDLFLKKFDRFRRCQVHLLSNICQKENRDSFQ